MDFELRRAREKLEKEQKQRKAEAKQRLEKERKSKLEAVKQREAIEASNRIRRLDAAQAQAKANLEMEESLVAGRGVMFSPILEAVHYQEGSGDKIMLPPSSFTQLSEQGAFDKGPLHFCVSVIQNSESMRSTHAGVLEFTADEGTVRLPPHLWSNLFPSNSTESSMVQVRYVWLPKGTYAKLQPHEPGFSDIPNHKAVLETSLRQHATLSETDVLTVYYGSLRYNLHVLELKPSSSVSVLETDIEVDIIGSDSSATTTDQLVLRPLTFQKPESGEIGVGNYAYYKFSLDEATWGRVLSGDVNVEVKLKALGQDGDTDLYVSRHPLLFPTRHQHGWSSHDVGTKTLVLSSKDHNMGPGSYSIAVYGFKGSTKYELSVNVEENTKQNLGQHAVASTSSLEQDTVECRNCRHYIPSRSIALHEAYCRRHNTVCQHAGCGIVLRSGEADNHVHCEKCGKAFQKGEIEKHMEIFHEPLNCPCGVVLEQEQMVQHQSSECPMRLITCQFCGDMVQAGKSPVDARDRMRGLSEHESLCGSRTAPCDSCGRAVMLKDMDIHQIAVHQKS